jgi:hypothetical protein
MLTECKAGCFDLREETTLPTSRAIIVTSLVAAAGLCPVTSAFAASPVSSGITVGQARGLAGTGAVLALCSSADTMANVGADLISVLGNAVDAINPCATVPSEVPAGTALSDIVSAGEYAAACEATSTDSSAQAENLVNVTIPCTALAAHTIGT